MLLKGVLTAFLFAFLLAPVTASAYCFDYAGARYGVSPSLLKAIAYVESSFNPYAVGDNGNGNKDYGLMQINNSSWSGVFGKHWYSVKSDPCRNVIAGAWILSKCFDRFGSKWEAVGCYNTGGIKGRTARGYVRKVQGAYGKLMKVKWR